MRTMVELVHNSCNIDDKVNPIRTGGGAGIHPPPTGFCPLLKKSAYDPYLKFLDFSQLLVADTPMKFSRKILFTPSDSTFVTPSKIALIKIHPPPVLAVPIKRGPKRVKQIEMPYSSYACAPFAELPSYIGTLL